MTSILLLIFQRRRSDRVQTGSVHASKTIQYFNLAIDDYSATTAVAIHPARAFAFRADVLNNIGQNGKARCDSQRPSLTAPDELHPGFRQDAVLVILSDYSKSVQDANVGLASFDSTALRTEKSSLCTRVTARRGSKRLYLVRGDHFSSDAVENAAFLLSHHKQNIDFSFDPPDAGESRLGVETIK